MAKRTISGGIETYRRASDGEWSHGMFGDEVDVHKDDVDRFDRLHPTVPEVEETEATEETEELDEGAYKGITVKDLKVEIEKRNEGRADDAKVTPAEPGNRPEIVAALLVDDEKNKQ